MRRPADQLRDLRKWRTSQPPDLSIAPEITHLTAGLKQESAAAAEVGGLLATLLPSTLAGHVSVRSFDRSTLVLACSHAAHRYTLDSWLRSGGLAALRKAVKATIKTIRTT